MTLLNATKNQILATDLKEASSFWDKTFGLIDPRNPRALLFQTRFGLHTFFLNTQVDVMVLNKEHQVVKLQANLRPWSFFFYMTIYGLVLELPAGSLKKTSTSLNDK